MPFGSGRARSTTASKKVASPSPSSGPFPPYMASFPSMSVPDLTKVAAHPLSQPPINSPPSPTLSRILSFGGWSSKKATQAKVLQKKRSSPALGRSNRHLDSPADVVPPVPYRNLAYTEEKVEALFSPPTLPTSIAMPASVSNSTISSGKSVDARSQCSRTPSFWSTYRNSSTSVNKAANDWEDGEGIWDSKSSSEFSSPDASPRYPMISSAYARSVDSASGLGLVDGIDNWKTSDAVDSPVSNHLFSPNLPPRSPPFDPAFEKSAALGRMSSPSLDVESSPGRIPSIRVEGLSMDDVFRELEEKLTIDEKELSEASVARRTRLFGSSNPFASAVRPSTPERKRPAAKSKRSKDPTKISPPSLPKRRDSHRASKHMNQLRMADIPPRRTSASVPTPPVPGLPSPPPHLQNTTAEYGIFSPRPQCSDLLTSAFEIKETGLGQPFNHALSPRFELPSVFVLPPTPQPEEGEFVPGPVTSPPPRPSAPAQPVLNKPRPAKTKKVGYPRTKAAFNSFSSMSSLTSPPPSPTDPLPTPPLSPSGSTISDVSSISSSPTSELFPRSLSASTLASSVADDDDPCVKMLDRLKQPHTPPATPLSTFSPTGRTNSAIAESTHTSLTELSLRIHSNSALDNLKSVAQSALGYPGHAWSESMDSTMSRSDSESSVYGSTRWTSSVGAVKDGPGSSVPGRRSMESTMSSVDLSVSMPEPEAPETGSLGVRDGMVSRRQSMLDDLDEAVVMIGERIPFNYEIGTAM